ncbi:GDP-L-fucose synthase [Candidatus Dependentiae bacterium]|nr:GDP-L-fucose synthase [Candidatus Dependentiae bacterium]
MQKSSKIYLAGHNGLVGSAVKRKLVSLGYENIVTRSFSDLDLKDQNAVNNFFKEQRPEYVIICAAKVGGIWANMQYPAQFIYDNLMIASNLIHASYLYGVKKLLFLGSSCIYPRLCPQPMKEEYLLSDYLESSNQPYAIAKIAGLELCKSYNRQYGTNFISCMPTNLYGPNDNFNLENSHVIPALIAKICDGKLKNLPSVEIWGTGNALREFLFVDDLADAIIYLMNNYDESEIINVGSGHEVSIKDLALKIKEIVGYSGELKFDLTKPDGTPRKLLDLEKLNKTGWKAKTTLEEGLKITIDWYLNIPHTTAGRRCLGDPGLNDLKF